MLSHFQGISMDFPLVTFSGEVTRISFPKQFGNGQGQHNYGARSPGSQSHGSLWKAWVLRLRMEISLQFGIIWMFSNSLQKYIHDSVVTYTHSTSIQLADRAVEWNLDQITRIRYWNHFHDLYLPPNRAWQLEIHERHLRDGIQWQVVPS